MADAPDAQAAANYAAIYPKGQQAITNNQTFLTNQTPTNADVLAQVRLLTKECTAILRILLGILDTTDGT